MKTKLSFTFLICALAGSLAIGQTSPNTVKIGYTDPEYILSMLPEYKQIESELKSHEKQLQTQLDGKLKEYQAKLKVYQEDLNTKSVADVIMQDKQKELITMQNNIKEFEENAMTSMQRKQAQLLDPVIQKVQNAIDSVAKENGYTYIFSTSAGSTAAIILYAKNKDEDITLLVLKKLGVTPPAETTTGTNTIIPPKTTTTTTNTNTNTTNTTNTTAPIKKK
ncbi:MAG: OmpH family outer membrane protein [Cytophagaceae bacterium]|nr:OmpH family outer membrane protein [Cytophagaceae bacterium]